MAHLTSQFTFDFKINCLEEMEAAEGREKNNAAAYARKHNIGVSSLKRWRKIGLDELKRQRIGRSKKKRKTRSDANMGRFESMEEKLYSLFLQHERTRRTTSDGWITSSAMKLMETEYPDALQGGKGVQWRGTEKWLRSFKNRFRIGRSAMQDIDKMTVVEFLRIWKDWMYEYRTFLLYSGKMVGPMGFIQSCDLYNFDESPLYFKKLIHSQNRSHDGPAAKELLLGFTRKLDKRICTLVITLRADAYTTKDRDGFNTRPMRPMIIFHGAGDVNEDEKKLYSRDVIVVNQKKAWFDRGVAMKYADSFRKHVRHNKYPRVVLVDNLDAHCFDKFVLTMREKSATYIRTLPKNTTHFSQPVDRHVAQTLKVKITKHFSDWFWKKHDAYVESGQTKKKKLGVRQLRVQITRAVALAWKDLTSNHEELLTKSFSEIGLSLPCDGSQDNLIKFLGHSGSLNYGL